MTHKCYINCSSTYVAINEKGFQMPNEKEIKIDNRPLYARGKRGFTMPLPISWVRIHNLKATHRIDIYQDENDRLILVPVKNEEKEGVEIA